MQHDDLIWSVIRHNHCSFMAKITTGNFCRNPYNVTGICNRSSCPLANSRYATIRDHDGVFYLYMKTIERAHKPNELWERIKLPRNYEKALETINKHLEYWPKLLVHKIKQRLTKMTQYRIRMRKLQLKVREKIMTLPRKEKKREARREEKAEKAAVLDKSIEKELLERLNKGVYGDIYNYPTEQYLDALNAKELQPSAEEEEEEAELEYVEDYGEELEVEDIEDYFQNDAYALENDKSDDEDEDDEETAEQSVRKKQNVFGLDSGAKSKKKGRVLIEVEEDEDTGGRQKAYM